MVSGKRLKLLKHKSRCNNELKLPISAGRALSDRLQLERQSLLKECKPNRVCDGDAVLESGLLLDIQVSKNECDAVLSNASLQALKITA